MSRVESMAEESPWLSLTEAAQRSGLARETVRARARRGLIPSQKGNRGEILVQLPSGVLSGPVQDMPAALSTLESDLLAEVSDLRERLARAESAREAALSTLAIEKAAAESVRMAEVAAKDDVIADLREQLAWHRRSWWRRFVGK